MQMQKQINLYFKKPKAKTEHSTDIKGEWPAEWIKRSLDLWMQSNLLEPFDCLYSSHICLADYIFLKYFSKTSVHES